MCISQDVAEEVRGRLRDGKLDFCQYQGMPQVQLHNRKEWWLQPYDLPQVQT